VKFWRRAITRIASRTKVIAFADPALQQQSWRMKGEERPD
jgi:hypothetical protein